jgi:hypothetical protein
MKIRFRREEFHAPEWEAWLDERPPEIRELAARMPPWFLYRLKSSGHIVTIAAFSEHEAGPPTLRVHVLRRYNPHILMERTVFGIPPEDLEMLGATSAPSGSR